MESVDRKAEDRMQEFRQLAAEIDPERLRAYLLALASKERGALWENSAT